ncbi:hypothetical protein LAZ67_3005721, partial [Cordylochernes scorpioides]
MPGHRKRRQFKQTYAFTRGMVIGLKRAGWSIRQIAADTHLGASTVHRLWRRWLEQGNVAIYRNVGATRVTSARVDRRILRQAVAATQATCTAILQHVQDALDHSISTITISRRLVANGLHSCRPLRRLPLTPPNRRQRLEWCRARSTWMTEWHRVVFSDESRFCLSSDSRRVRVWRRRGERSNPAAIVERPTVRQRGIMVWGAIAYDSRSPLLRIQGTMTAQRYVDDVLRPVTLPYLQGVPNALYQQDNARPHIARISQQALQDVQMLPWPPYSPDLSPIEHVWDIIGRRLHALPQPRSEDELWQMVEREWRAIPQDAIRTLIDSLPRRVAACIAVRELEVVREVDIKNLGQMASTRPHREPPKMGDFTFAEFNLKRLVKFGLSRPPIDIPYVNFKELYEHWSWQSLIGRPPPLTSQLGYKLGQTGRSRQGDPDEEVLRKTHQESSHVVQNGPSLILPGNHPEFADVMAETTRSLQRLLPLPRDGRKSANRLRPSSCAVGNKRMPGHRKRRQFKQTDAFTRGMVIGLKRAGWSIRQIAADTHLGASTVYQLWRRWLEKGNVAIYSNQSDVSTCGSARRVRVWRRRGERSNPAAIVERPTVRQRGIMVWGAIAYDSRSPLLRIQGTMTAQRNVDDVLRPVTLPYLQGVPNALYQQDNARPHTARISQQALQDVQMLPWPPYSPDLSPIEHVWDIIGSRLHALPQPRSEDELWQMVPQDAIRTLIDSLPRRVAACIAVR